MSYLLLTSNGLSSEAAIEKVKTVLPNLKNRSAVIITTAAKDKENNKWNIITKNQFLDLGYEEVEYLDLETNPQVNLAKFSTIYVCGGNTFKLLKAIKESNFEEEVRKLLNNYGFYIGASAGALILTPTIQIAGEVSPDENLVELKDFTAFGIVDFEFLPHYSIEMEEELEIYKNKTNYEIKTATNEEVIFIEL